MPASGLVIRWTTRWWEPRDARYDAPAGDIAVYADGTVVGASTVDFEVRPMVWPYVTGTIDVATVADLLEAASRSGLLAPAEPTDGNSSMVGAPVTFVELRSATGTFHHQVHALQSPSVADTEYLVALRRLVTTLQQLTEAALDPLTAASADVARVAVTATPVDPEPARSRTEWPGGLDLSAASRCTVTDDPATIAVLTSHPSGEHFVDGDVTYAVTAYQLVPGETDCFGGSSASSADGVVIEITTQPLFPVVPPFVGAGPSVVVLGDGTVFARFAGLFDAEPMVWPYQQGAISAAELDALVDLAATSGLLGDPEPQPPRVDVADAPLTTVVIATPDGRFVHRAAALESPPADESAYLRSLREFVGAVAATGSSVSSAGSSWAEPAALAVQAAPADGAAAGEPVPWPAATPLASLAECRVITDPDVIAVLDDATAGRLYTDAGITYRLAARVAFAPTC